VTESNLREVVDIVRVPSVGDPAVAVVRVPESGTVPEIECEIVVVGGGTGGVAAALAAARRNRSVCLVEETDWLGGQLTSQGVSALDEHDLIESFGGTASYYGLRELIRDHYEDLGLLRGEGGGNPGSCWVSGLAFEPAVAVRAIDALLAPFVESGAVRILRRCKPIGVRTAGGRIESVTVLDLVRLQLRRLRAELVIDATELGDLLPLAGLDYVVGAEAAAETGEPHAQPGEPKRECVQSFTYTFALERTSDASSGPIPAPEKYEHYRDAQPYSLTIEVHGGEIYGEESGRLSYRLFERMAGTKGSLWTYRRLVDAKVLPRVSRNDLTLFNWPGNDYRDRSILDLPSLQAAAALQDAKRVSLGFLHWLQTSAPTEGERLGAPELLLRPDLMGTTDGLSKHPYIRESRRIRALRTIVEQDVSVEYQSGPRAAPFADSIGIGWYPIDIHRAGPEDVGVSTRTRPFQIPLGALIPVGASNLLAAAKNIGTTHITNGCYRLHPVEWNIGEAGGALAAWSLETGCTPEQVWHDETMTRRFQRSLLEEGVPLAWVTDVPIGHPSFAAVQAVAVAGAPIAPEGLELGLDAVLSPAEWRDWGGSGEEPPTRRDGVHRLSASLDP
jgi:FAD dependent oxidoreductase